MRLEERRRLIAEDGHVDLRLSVEAVLHGHAPRLAAHLAVLDVFLLGSRRQIDAEGDRITPRTLPVPGRTAWRPNGCQ